MYTLIIVMFCVLLHNTVNLNCKPKEDIGNFINCKKQVTVYEQWQTNISNLSGEKKQDNIADVHCKQAEIQS